MASETGQQASRTGASGPTKGKRPGHKSAQAGGTGKKRMIADVTRGNIQKAATSKKPGKGRAKKFEPEERIRATLKLLTGARADEIAAWLQRPNADLAGETPESLINAGRARVVAELLESIMMGVPG
jgi:hypothetical protein